MTVFRVLIVEDQHDIAANIWDFLERRGHMVDHAADGQTGLMRAMGGQFDAIVLDLGLPRLDGLDLCRQLRQAGRGTPVLMLTARDALEDKIKGYAEGADDYMVKPFELRELEVRLRALNRRSQTTLDEPLRVGPLTYDRTAMLARRGHIHVSLTGTQARILELLMRRSPSVVDHSALIDYVWGADSRGTAVLHSHVHTLRTAIDKPFDFGMIQSVHGIGYRLIAPDA